MLRPPCGLWTSSLPGLAVPLLGTGPEAPGPLSICLLVREREAKRRAKEEKERAAAARKQAREEAARSRVLSEYGEGGVQAGAAAMADAAEALLDEQARPAGKKRGRWGGGAAQPAAKPGGTKAEEVIDLAGSDSEGAPTKRGAPRSLSPPTASPEVADAGPKRKPTRGRRGRVAADPAPQAQQQPKPEPHLSDVEQEEI